MGMRSSWASVSFRYLTIRYTHTLSQIKLEMDWSRNLLVPGISTMTICLESGDQVASLCVPLSESWCPISPSSHVTQKALYS